MKTLLFIFLPLIIFNVDLNKYSINSLLDFLENTGFYEVLKNVKIVLGNDIAIEVCKEFVNSKDCDLVVVVYIPIKQPEELNDNSNRDDFDFFEEIGLEELLMKDENLEILSQFYTKNEILDKSKIILKRQN